MTTFKHADFEVPGFGELATPPVAVPAYADAIGDLNPLAYWRLGEATGDTLADQTAAHPLALSGAATLGQAGALATDDDTAVLFSGGTAASDQPVLPTVSNAPFSIVFWIRLPAGGSPPGLFLGQFIWVASGHMRLLLLPGGKVRYLLTDDPILNTSKAITPEWCMLALTRSSAGTVTWYADGQPDNQGTGHGTAVASVPMKLGALTASPPSVCLDEVAVFGDELSADQVRWLHGLGTANLALPPGS